MDGLEPKAVIQFDGHVSLTVDDLAKMEAGNLSRVLQAMSVLLHGHVLTQQIKDTKKCLRMMEACKAVLLEVPVMIAESGNGKAGEAISKPAFEAKYGVHETLADAVKELLGKRLLADYE